MPELYDKLVMDGVVYKETPNVAVFAEGQGVGMAKRTLAGRRVVVSTRREATTSSPGAHMRAIRSRELRVDHEVEVSPASYRLRDHVLALEASMKVFHFQLDTVLSRAYTVLTPVDGPGQFWAAPTWPIRPYGHAQGTVVQDSDWIILVNRIRVTTGFTVDKANGIVIFDADAIPGPNAIVNMAYTCRLPVRIKQSSVVLSDLPLSHLGLSYVLELQDDFAETPLQRYEDYSELEFLSGFVESDVMTTGGEGSLSSSLAIALSSTDSMLTGDTAIMSSSVANAVALAGESEMVTDEDVTLGVEIRLGVSLSMTSVMVTGGSATLNGGFGRVDLV